MRGLYAHPTVYTISHEEDEDSEVKQRGRKSVQRDCGIMKHHTKAVFVCAFHLSRENGVPYIFTNQANQNIWGTQEKLQNKS